MERIDPSTMSRRPTRRRTGVARRDARSIVVLLRAGTEIASWPLGAHGRLDLAVVHQLASLQLAARRVDCSILVRGAPSALRELLELSGLTGVVACVAGSVEVGGEPERREQAGVEEVVAADDPRP
jgi:ABC-type transporter Mla MlaB component